MAEDHDGGAETARPGRMAGGHNRIARDLDAAMHCPKFTGVLGTLIFEARYLSYTLATIRKRPDPIPFRINCAELARDHDLDASWLCRQVKRLARWRVFLDLGDGTYLINKDYREWVDDGGEPLLTESQRDRCRRYIRQVRPCESNTSDGLNGAVLAPLGARCETHSDGLNGAVSPTTDFAVPPAPPIAEPGAAGRACAGAESFLESIRESNLVPSNPPTNAGAGDPPSAGRGWLGAEGDEALPPSGMPEGFLAVTRKADAIPTLAGLGPRLRGAWSSDGGFAAWWSEYPDHPGWTRALLDLAGQPAEKRHPAYYLAIARRLVAARAVRPEAYGHAATNGQASAAPPPNKAALRRQALAESLERRKALNESRSQGGDHGG